jgi:hypothetical protein
MNQIVAIDTLPRRIAGAQALADFGYQRIQASRLDNLTARGTIGHQRLQLVVQELSQHGRLIGDGVREGILRRPDVGRVAFRSRSGRRHHLGKLPHRRPPLP